MNEQPSNQLFSTSSTYLKFTIGVMAGCSVVVIPRLSAYFFSSNDPGFTYFPTIFLFSALVFSLILGSIIVIFEYKIPKPPRETFFAALAIPGLVAGSINTTMETNNAITHHQESYELTKEVQNNNNILTEEVESPKLILIDLSENRTIDNNAIFSIDVIRAVYASEQDQVLEDDENNLDIAINRTKNNFAVSIGKYKDKESALNAARKYREIVTDITLIESNNEYRLITSKKLLTETEATIEAIKMKNQLGEQPALIKVK